MNEKQEKRFKEIAREASDVGLIVLDEGSFNDITILAHISARMVELRKCTRPFGGVPVLLLLDFHQKQCVGGTQLHKALIVADLPDDLLQALKVNCKGKEKVIISNFKADRIGVNLMRRFRRVNLIQQMRASDDPEHSAHITQIRDIHSEQPINESILESLQPLTAKALANDPKLRFARIACMSWREIFPLTVMQITRWARAHKLPVIRWKKLLIGASAGFIDEDETEQLYKHESDGLYEYFAEGIPGTFNENIDTLNGVVNGGKNTYVSITMDDDEPPLEDLILEASEDEANWIDDVLFVTLCTRPLSLNVKMCVTKEQELNMRQKNYLLPNAPGYDPSTLDGPRDVHLALTLMPGNFGTDTYTPTSLWASHDMPKQFTVRFFPLVPDFVVTDFKVQGTTEAYLISCLRPRKHLPGFTVQSFNVQFSRVTLGKNFYALGLDKKNMDHLRCLQHNPTLVIWEQGYGADGRWDRTLALAAAEQLLAKQQERKKAAKGRKRQKVANRKQQAQTDDEDANLSDGDASTDLSSSDDGNMGIQPPPNEGITKNHTQNTTAQFDSKRFNVDFIS